MNKMGNKQKGDKSAQSTGAYIRQVKQDNKNNIAGCLVGCLINCFHVVELKSY
jgi:hypothetical protein